MNRPLPILFVLTALGTAGGCSLERSEDDDAAGASGSAGTGAGSAGSAGKGTTSGGSAGKGSASGGNAGSNDLPGGAGASSSGHGGEAGDDEPGAGRGGEGGEAAASNPSGGSAGKGGTNGGTTGESGAGSGGGGSGNNAGSGGNGGPDCSTERTAALAPVDAVSTGAVTLISGQPRVLYIDASAGGVTQQAQNPWIYVNLATNLRVNVTDLGADESTAWDLAFKREGIRSNGGDSGPGQASVALLLNDDFDSVVEDDVAQETFEPDEFVDEQCVVDLDDLSKPVTRFTNWFDYDSSATERPATPKPIVFVIRGADGQSLYKLVIESYYSTDTGAEGTSGARYRVRYASL